MLMYLTYSYSITVVVVVLDGFLLVESVVQITQVFKCSNVRV